MNKKITLAGLFFLLSGVLGLFGLGSKDSPDFIIANGTGSTISKIQIIGAGVETLGDHELRTAGGILSPPAFNLKDVDLKDTGVMNIYLPDAMKEYDFVDIVVQCGFRKFETRQAVNIKKGFFGKPKLLDFSKKGKDSTFLAATGAGVGGTLAVAGIGTAFITGVATNGGAAYVPWALYSAGSLVGGGMAAGVAVVAAVPLAAAAVVGGITWGIGNLFPGELIVKSIDYNG